MTHSKFKVYAHALPTPTDLASPGFSISGRLCIQIDNVYFPTENWYDYVVPVLGWWIDNAMRLYLPESEVTSIVMDGSYEIRMRRAAGADDVRLTLYENGKARPDQYIIGYGRCLAALRGAAKSVLNELKDLGVDERGEIWSLRNTLDQVIRLESQINTTA